MGSKNWVKPSDHDFLYSFFTGGPIGEAPLHIAARIEEARGEKCTKMLLKSGADTNLAMTDGRTPLHIAAESGSIAVLKLLLAHDADALSDDAVRFITRTNLLSRCKNAKTNSLGRGS